MLPREAPPTRNVAPLAANHAPRGSYNPLISRNMFSIDGVMPPAMVAAGTGDQKQQEDAPVLSALPLNLIGTIVFAIPEKSIATVELKSKNLVQAFSVGSEIDSIAKIEKVEREKVIFRNLNNNRLEFIEMKSTSKLSFKAGVAEVPSAKSKEVVETAPNKYKIKKSDLLKYTNNLNEILQQARAVPNRDPKTGEITCFRILDIAPGSIYEQFGIQRMDCISSVNGQPITSPQQALEMYNALKNSSNVSIGYERGGKTDQKDFTVE